MHAPVLVAQQHQLCFGLGFGHRRIEQSPSRHAPLALQQRRRRTRALASSPTRIAPEEAERSTPAMGREASSSDKGLVGFERFVRQNPLTDRFGVIGFHHVELWCGDATNTWKRFAWGLGLRLVAKSDQTTGNRTYCSYVAQSGDLVLVFTAPYSAKLDQAGSRAPHPGFSSAKVWDFFDTHGLGVRAVGVRVEDAEQAFRISVDNGAIGVLEPQILKDDVTGGQAVISEVSLYGDVVLRYISSSSSYGDGDAFQGPFLPNYEPVESPPNSFGLLRLDHAVGNVPNLLEATKHIAGFTGFHEFAEFTSDDVGTAESGLNSMVLASNNEFVLLPINEPVHGTKRKSQIQTYLEHNEGAGLQHLALVCEDIFATLKEMRMRSDVGGFEFMPRPNKRYYQELPSRIGSSLSKEQMELCEELGILVDKDDQGILLQIFTKPVGDRPTLFLEIIQRVGCMETVNGKAVQKGGCGGFGKGNFSALFKSIEDYEKTLDGTIKSVIS